MVPTYWWPESGLDRAELRMMLDRRMRQMETIIELRKWEGLDDILREARTDELF
jgi:hypothetical protein